MKRSSELRIIALSIFIAMGCGTFLHANDLAPLAPLFNGEDISQFDLRGGNATYRVDNGVIVGTSVKGGPNTFLCTQMTYANFILEYEFKVHPEMNSGVQIRSNSLPDYKKGLVHGYQIEIDPGRNPHKGSDGRQDNLDEQGQVVEGQPRSWSGGIYDEGRRGWLNDLAKNPKARQAFKPDDWNHIRVSAVGDHIQTWINGVPAADLKDSMTPAGFIAFQVHGTESDTPMDVAWRNILILDLDRCDPGAIVLTDGKLPDAWLEPAGKWFPAGDAKIHPENEARLTGLTGTGVLMNGEEGKTNDILSKESFGDVQLHVEFMVPKGSNSGVYLMGRYEIQVCDSFGKTGVNYSDCGGIYQRWDENRDPKGFEGIPPLVNAATTPGTWQSFDITFKAPRFNDEGKKISNAQFVTAVYNGKLIHKHQELSGPTRGAIAGDKEAAQGPLRLQGDHGPVAYRNIRIRKIDLN